MNSQNSKRIGGTQKYSKNGQKDQRITFQDKQRCDVQTTQQVLKKQQINEQYQSEQNYQFQNNKVDQTSQIQPQFSQLSQNSNKGSQGDGNEIQELHPQQQIKKTNHTIEKACIIMSSFKEKQENDCQELQLDQIRSQCNSHKETINQKNRLIEKLRQQIATLKKTNHDLEMKKQADCFRFSEQSIEKQREIDQLNKTINDLRNELLQLKQTNQKQQTLYLKKDIIKDAQLNSQQYKYHMESILKLTYEQEQNRQTSTIKTSQILTKKDENQTQKQDNMSEIFNHITQNIKNLKQKLCQLKTKYELKLKQNKRIKVLQSQNSSIKHILESKQLQIYNLRQQLSVYEIQSFQMKRQKIQHVDKINQLKKAVKDYNCAIDQMMQKNNEKCQQINKLNKMNQQLIGQKQSIYSSLKSQIQRITQAFKQVKQKLQMQNQQLTSLNTKLTQQIININQKLTQLSTQNDRINQETAQQTQKFKDLHLDLQFKLKSEFGKQISVIEKERGQLKSQLAKSKQLIQQMEGQIRFLNENHANKQRDLLSNLDKQKAHMFDQFSQNIKAHEARYGSSVQTIDRLYNYIDQLSKKLQQRTNRLIQLQEYFVEHEKYIGQLKINLAQFQQKLFDSRMQLLSKDNQIEKCNNRLKQLQQSHKIQIIQTQQHYQLIINMIQQNIRSNFKSSTERNEQIRIINQSNTKLIEQMNDLSENEDIMMRQYNFNAKIQEKQKEISQLLEKGAINELNYYKRQKELEEMIYQNQKMIKKWQQEAQSKSLIVQHETTLNTRHKEAINNLSKSITMIKTYRNAIYDQVDSNNLLSILNTMDDSLHIDDEPTSALHDLMRMIAYKQQFYLAKVQQDSIYKQKTQLQKTNQLSQFKQIVSQYKKKIEKLQLELNKQVQQKVQLRMKMDEMNDKFLSQEKQMNKLKNSNDEQKGRWIERIKKSEQQVMRYKSEIDSKGAEDPAILLSQANSLKEYLQEAHNRIDSYKELIKQKQAKQKLSNDQMLKLQQKLKSLDHQYESIRRNSKLLQTKNNELKDQLNILKRQRLNKSQLINDDPSYKQKYEQSSIQLMNSQMKLQAQQQINEQLHNEIKQLKKNINNIKKDNNQLNSILKSKQNYNKNTISSSENQNNIKQKYQKQIKENQNTIAQLLQKIQEIQSQSSMSKYMDDKQDKESDVQMRLQVSMYQNLQLEFTILEEQNEKNKEKIRKLQLQLQSIRKGQFIRSKSPQRSNMKFMQTKTSIKSQNNVQSNIFSIPCILSDSQNRQLLIKMIEEVTKKVIKQTKIYYKCQQYCKAFSLNTVKQESLNQSFVFLLKSKDNIFAVLTSKFQTNNKPSAALFSINSKKIVNRKNKLEISPALTIDAYGQVTIANGLIKIKSSSRQITIKQSGNKYFQPYDKKDVFGKQGFRDDFIMEMEMFEIYRVSFK